MTTHSIEPPAPPELPTEPLTSVQTQIGLALTALAGVVAFIFHKDFSPIVPALTVVAFAGYGATVSIARAMKHRTVVNAQLAVHDQKMAVWAHQTPPTPGGDLVEDINDLHDRLVVLEEVQKAPSGASTGSGRARSASTPAKARTRS